MFEEDEAWLVIVSESWYVSETLWLLLVVVIFGLLVIVLLVNHLGVQNILAQIGIVNGLYIMCTLYIYACIFYD